MKRFKILALIIAIMLANIITLPVFADPGPSISLSVDHDVGVVGDIITMTGTLDNNPGIVGYDMIINYDDAILKVDHYDVAAGWVDQNPPSSAGALRVSATSVTQIAPPLLATVYFEILSEAVASTNITLEGGKGLIKEDQPTPSYNVDGNTGVVTIISTPLTYGISLDPPSRDFGSVTIGYTTVPAAQTVKIKNTGNQATGVLTFAITGATAAFDCSLENPIASIAVNGDTTFTVRPRAGLAEGTYRAEVTITGTNGISATFVATFTVGTPPPPPPISTGDGGGGGGTTPTTTAPTTAAGTTTTGATTTTAGDTQPTTTATTTEPATQPTIETAAPTTTAKTTEGEIITDATPPQTAYPTTQPTVAPTTTEKEEIITDATEVPKGSFETEPVTTKGPGKVNPPTGANIITWTLIIMAMLVSAAAIVYFKKRSNKFK